MEKKVFKVLIMIIVLVIAVSTVVQAASFTASMTPSSTTVAPETEFTVTVKISNLDVGSNGINSLSGYLTYDDAVFETINESSIEGVNDWKPTFSSDNGRITLLKTQFVNSEEAVFQITFKTKSETDLKKKTSGIIKLSQVVASNSQDDITASDISTTITISTATTNETDNATTNSPLVLKTNTTKNTTVKNTTTNLTNNKVVNNTVNKTENNVGAAINSTTKNTTVYNTVEEDDIPYTGVEDTIVYVLFVAIAMALVFYIKFEKINKDIR
jgi:hypothetical protein